MKLKGYCHCFGDNVSTDDIIAGKYKNRILDVQELSKHLMENLDPNFCTKFKHDDFIVGGKNFGTGSSRESAPRVITYAGCKAVIAKSFARIFYRNSFNVGLLLLECDTSKFKTGDLITIDTKKGKITNIYRDEITSDKPIPKFMEEIISKGGLLAHFKLHGNYSFVDSKNV